MHVWAALWWYWISGSLYRTYVWLDQCSYGIVYMIQTNKPECGTHLFRPLFIIKQLFVWTDAALALIADTDHIGLWIILKCSFWRNIPLTTTCETASPSWSCQDAVQILHWPMQSLCDSYYGDIISLMPSLRYSSCLSSIAMVLAQWVATENTYSTG